MATGKKEGMCEGGHVREREAPVRQSRRSQGLPPEKQNNLHDVVREARKASAAKRKATKEEKERSSADARPAPEPAALDAHQVSKGDDSGGRLTQSEAVEGESVQDEPAQASEGGANVEVSLEVDRVSDSKLPGQDVGLLDDALVLADDKPLATVQEDAVLEDLNVSSHLRRDLALARDLTAVQIPVELCTARECVAILQTLLVEAGFQFDNLISEWFRTAASRVMVNSIRESVGNMLRLLAGELIEWRQLVVGAKFKIVPSLDVQEVSERPPILEYHAEDTEGDLLMTDHV
ncbi:unnamed protein product [Phytophthora fragariaefolia]|uniref:Unnamed protein product n=1 Tax=Phytophthora fragariaefolia TaxID=1490495 RepID=A0A9W6WP54_9STRA|nr:unnamed protein product [Phytophthora fragariaefolia]